MAEMLFRDLVKDREGFQVSSAGVGAMPGMKASGHTAALLDEKGIPNDAFRSQPLTYELMKRATHVFAMTDQHLRILEMEYPELADRAYLVTEFVADDGVRGKDIPDPVGMGKAAYEETRDLLQASLPSLLAYIDQTGGSNPASSFTHP